MTECAHGLALEPLDQHTRGLRIILQVLGIAALRSRVSPKFRASRVPIVNIGAQRFAVVLNPSCILPEVPNLSSWTFR